MSNVGRPGNGRPRCAKTPATAAERRARLLPLVSSLRPKEAGLEVDATQIESEGRNARVGLQQAGTEVTIPSLPVELRRTSAVMIERGRPYCQIVDGHRLPGSFSEEVYRSGLRYRPEPGDVVLDTFPKCGTHWVLGILKAAYKVCRGITPGSAFLEKLGLEAIEKCAKPRIVFTHLPFQLVPFSDAAKYIYVIRNPKDCCVSFYHHTKNIPVYNFQDGTFDEYFEIFLDGRTDFGSYYESLRSWYARRNELNVLFLTYEGIHADVRGSVLEITRFVDSTIADDLAQDEDKMKTVLENSSVGSMKKQFEVQFVRKGVVGDWRNYFSPELSRRLEERFFREMEGTDIAKLWDAADWLQDRAKS